jgi:hypothetical protein
VLGNQTHLPESETNKLYLGKEVHHSEGRHSNHSATKFALLFH